MIPNYLETVARLAREHPQEWRDAHTSSPNTEAFIRRLAFTLNQMDPNVGLNGKRGNPNDISDDVIAIYTAEGSVVDRSGLRMEIIDVIAGAGGPNPQPSWAAVGGPSPGAWVKPQPVGTIPPVVKPCPDPKAHEPKPPVPYPDETTFWRAYELAVVEAYRARGREIDSQSFRWFTRVAHDIAAHRMNPEEAAAKHLQELQRALAAH
jgi:hypothetical protein